MGYSPTFTAGFTATNSFQSFENIASSSILLSSMVDQLFGDGGAVTANSVNDGGTYSGANYTIYIAPTVMPTAGFGGTPPLP
jgi:hypothetical protein